MVIQHNITAMNSQRMLGVVTGLQAKSSEKLSSGYKINRAADDAAGLSISEKMRRQIRGLTQASANAQDGISMVRIADGAMEEIQAMLQRANELCVKSANGSLTSTDRKYIQQEIDQITEEVDNVHKNTTFNEINVLDGPSESSSKLPDWVTMDAASEASGAQSSTFTDAAGKTHYCATIDFSDYSASRKESLYGTGFYCTCFTCSNYYSIQLTSGTGYTEDDSNSGYYVYSVGIDGCNSGEDLVNKIVTATNGRPGKHNTYVKADENNSSQLVIYDIRSISEVTANAGKFGSGVKTATPEKSPLYLQVGAEQGNTMEIKLPNVNSNSTKISSVIVTTAEKASKGINLVKTGLNFISQERSRMGAYENRLEHTIKNLDNVIENTTSAESEIRDTDMSSEMVKYSNNNVLAQAGQSMLAQANKNNQGILSLLQ